MGRPCFTRPRGRLSAFRRQAGEGGGPARLSVRTKLRPDLLELFDLAMEMQAELEPEATSSNKTDGSANDGPERRDL